MQSTATVKILTGMRSGDVLEVQIDFNKNYTNVDDIMRNEKLSEEQKIVEMQKI